jgi:hypothetical protein
VDGDIDSAVGEAESGQVPRTLPAGGMRTRPAATACGALIGLSAVALALHAFLVGRVHGPLVFMDELGYERMAQSFAHTGHFALFGKGGLAYSPLYPIALSPLYELTASMHTAYEWAKVENTVLMSLSIFPTYGIARFVLSRERSLGVAALSLLAPLMLYSGFEMSESLAYPLCLLAIWTMLRAVRRPSVANDALLLGAIVLASAARLQLVVLGPAALTAVLVVGLARGRLAGARKAVSEHRLLFGVAVVAVVGGLGRAAMNGGNLPLAGRYSNVGTAHPGAWRVVELFFEHLAELDFAVGVIPFATALVAGYALVRFGFPQRALVFASVAVGCAFWLLLEVALDAAAFDATSAQPKGRTAFTDLPRIHERYLIYLVPLFFVALFATFGLRRSRLPRLPYLIAAAVVAATLPALIPFGTVINGTTAIDSFALQLFGRTRGGQVVPVAHATGSILVVSAILAVVFLLAVSRQLPPLSAVLLTGVVLLGLSALEVGKQVTPVSRGELGLPTYANWVDRRLGSSQSVSLVGGDGVRIAALRETAFWNASVTHVFYTCSPAFGADFGETPVPAGGIHARFAVVPAALQVSGRVLARDSNGKLALVAPTKGLLRLTGRGCGG